MNHDLNAAITISVRRLRQIAKIHDDAGGTVSARAIREVADDLDCARFGTLVLQRESKPSARRLMYRAAK